jgi:hypothetical protein
MAYLGKTRAMPFQPAPRRLLALASVPAVSLMLGIAGCGHVAPIGPDHSPGAIPPPVAMPASPSHLGSPIILQVMRSQPPAPAGGCQAGWVALSVAGSARTCYRKLGTPVTITSAAVSSVDTNRPHAPSGHAAPPASYGIFVAVPAADVAPVTAVVKRAYDSRGALAISVAGRTWAALQVITPFRGQQFEISLPSKNHALQLYRILVPAS